MALDIRRPTSVTDNPTWTTLTDPTYAYDESGTATYATLLCNKVASASAYGGISNASKPTYTALSLRIYLDAVFGADSGDCIFDVSFSLDGKTYTSIDGPWTSDQVGLELTQTLSTSLDLSTLTIKISAVGGTGAGQSVSLKVYDIWTEGTYTPAPEPCAAFFMNFC